MSKSTNAGRCESIRSFCRSGVLRMIACRRAEQRTGLTWKINISPENGTLGRDVFEVNYLVVLAKGEVSPRHWEMSSFGFQGEVEGAGSKSLILVSNQGILYVVF